MIPTRPEGVIWTEEQWRAIYLEGSNIIVSAGAGSGKTAVLTERIIEKLKKGINIDQMIILTFTNAAAGEMKTRIRDKIIDSLNNFPKLKDQLVLVDQATITTFDSFSLSLVKKYHYLLNIPKEVRIIDNVLLQTVKKEAFDCIFEKYYNDNRFLNLLNTYTTKDDENIKNSILNIYNKIDSICKKTDYLNEYIDKYYNEEFIRNNINKYNELLNQNRDIMMSLLETISNEVTNEKLVNFFNSLTETLDPLNYAKKYNDYIKVLSDFKVPTLRKSKDLEQDEINEIKDYFDKFKGYLNDLRDLLNYESEDELFNEIMSTKEFAAVIIDILLDVDKYMFNYKMSKNAYEFSDIQRLAISLLENHSEIAKEIRDYTNEIMIDEYQDTNDIGDYFVSLISNNNVYMVGDVKQSIYRFRNANPKIFMDKYHNYKLHNGGEAIDLTKNFRSRDEVLAGINHLFKYIMDEQIGGANYTNGHTMIYGNMAYKNFGTTAQNYDLEILDYKYKNTEDSKQFSKDEIEAFIVADDIIKRVNNKEQIFNMKKKELRDIKYSDFVILLDRASNFELFKKIFDYKGIPLIVHKDEKFAYSNEIYIIKNLLKLIYCIREKDYAEFNYSFISVARSYLYNFDDNDIFTSITNKDIMSNPLFAELIEKLKKLAELSKNLNLSTLITSLYDEFNLYYASIRIGNVGNTNIKLDYIVSVAENLENTGYSLKDFITYFDNVFENELDIQFSLKKDTSSNSVNIMTIHKSKGLEYPICYFPHLYKKFNKMDLNDRFLFDLTYGIVMPIFKEGLTNTFYKKLLADNYIIEDISERLRVLYVALTRAKEKMIMISPFTEIEHDALPFNDDLVNNLERMNYSSFQDVMLSLKNEVGKYITSVEYKADKKYELSISKSYEKLIKNNKNIYSNVVCDIKSKDEKKENFSHSVSEIIDSTKTSAGLLVHEVLEYLDFKNYKEDIKNYEIDDFFKYKIFNLFKMPFMNNIINSKIFKEYEFYSDKSCGIIDLLIEDDENITIVDYKLKDIDEDYYIDQVKGYIKYIKSISNKNVKGYLYSIIESNFKEIS